MTRAKLQPGEVGSPSFATLASGRVQARLRFRRHDGSLHRVSVSDRTRQGAARLARVLAHERMHDVDGEEAAALGLGPSSTLGEVATAYLAVVDSRDVENRPQTRNGAKRTIRTHIIGTTMSNLPGNACRLLVIDGVPVPLSPSEARAAAGLSGTETFAASETQRIEQGMGRGIRQAEDYCAVLLMGSNLARSLQSPAMRKHYSPATRAQIDLSLELAAQIRGEGLSGISEALTLFLERDEQWRTVSRDATAGIEYESEGNVSAITAARRQAFDLARAGRPQEAERAILASLRGASVYERGWYLEEAAAYAHRYSTDRAQELLREARIANVHVLMPISAPPVRVLRASAEQGVAASQYLSSRYSSGVDLELGFTRILDSLVFSRDKNVVEAAEAAFEELGLHLGFQSDRPDKRYRTGPDVIWVGPGDVHLVVELKTGVDREDGRIIKSEMDQLAGHLNWRRENYGESPSVTPLLIHPTHFFSPEATPSPGTVALTADCISDLRQRCIALARALANNDGWKSADTVRGQLTANDLIGRSALVNRTSIVQKSESFVLNPHSPRAKTEAEARAKEQAEAPSTTPTQSATETEGVGSEPESTSNAATELGPELGAAPESESESAVDDR